MNAPPDLGVVLLQAARSAIARRLGVAYPPVPPHPALAQPGATFVTLQRRGRLRGCIGSVSAHRALGADVTANALAAAFADPRFPRLTRAEYDDVAVEVSLLSASAPIVAADEPAALAQLRPHVDGVILQYGMYRSTFLPQVWEQLPDRREFLTALKRKAGLAADFWDPRLELARYTVAKFAEPAAPGVPEAAR